ncbi:MAG: hydrolase [Mariprofundus sp.]
MRLECGCPSEFPDWDGQDIDLGATLVHEQASAMFFHMPIGFEACLDRQHHDIGKLGLNEQWPGFVLAESGMFRGRILALLTEDNSPARKTYRLKNPYMLRVQLFKGNIRDIKTSIRQMQSELFDEGRMPKNLFLSYLTCPRCQQERGGTRIMLLRHWVRSPKLEQRLEKQKNT